MTIKWLVGSVSAIVSLAGVTLLLSTASAADRIVRVRSLAPDISGAQKSALGDAAVALFPGTVKANAFRLWCTRRPSGLECFAKENKSGTADQFYTDLDDPTIRARETGWDGSTSTWEVTRRNSSLTAQNRTDLATFLAAVWPTAALANVTDFACLRDEDDASVIGCVLRELQTLAPADARDAINNNPGSEDVGVVVP